MSASRVRAYVGLGSNLQDPRRQLTAALAALAGLRVTRLVASSSLYRSPPLGPPGQPDYLNAVAALDTALPADRLLSALQAIEARQGRRRAERWGPRTLDLDILTYGDLRSDRVITLSSETMRFARITPSSASTRISLRRARSPASSFGSSRIASGIR